MRRGAAILAGVVLLALPALGAGETSIESVPAAETQVTWHWQKIGCEKGYGWKAARRGIAHAYRGHEPLTKKRTRAAWRYARCTYRAAHSRQLISGKCKRPCSIAQWRRWRRKNVCGVGGGTGYNRAANVRLAKCMARRDYGWTGVQWSGCLYPLLDHESGSTWWPHKWNTAGSGALGIAQALPASKYAAAIRKAGETIYHAVVQVRWGLAYIAGRYGTPCNAWAFHGGNNWY